MDARTDSQSSGAPAPGAASTVGASTGVGSMPAATGRQRVVAAGRGENALPVPIWLMRQAGRYLEEYRAVRERVDFLTLCKTPDLATEVTLQPLRRFPLDAAILFSDIMVLVEPLGLTLDYRPGPVIDPPIRCRADIARLRDAGDAGGLDFAIDTVRRLRAALGPERALIGFAGAPVTLATYMCEGQGAREFRHFKALAHADPRAAHDLLARLAGAASGFLQAQVEAGCDCVQLFDTWAGTLDPFDFDEFVVPHVRRIADELRGTGAPLIYYCRDASALLERLPATGATAFGLDWRADLAAARRALGGAPVQGNLDPVLLLGDVGAMVERATRILAAGGGRGHIFNLGHGVLKETPPGNVGRLVEAVRSWRPAAAGRPAGDRDA